MTWTPTPSPQASKQAARRLPLEHRQYNENAEALEKLACEVMDNCLAESDAVTILVRQNAVWPSTIMRIAMEGEHKRFVFHPMVQRIVDWYWRGKRVLSPAWLPPDVNGLQILTHACIGWCTAGVIKMEKPRDRQHGSRHNMRRQSTLALHGSPLMVPPPNANPGLHALAVAHLHCLVTAATLAQGQLQGLLQASPHRLHLFSAP